MSIIGKLKRKTFVALSIAAGLSCSSVGFAIVRSSKSDMKKIAKPKNIFYLRDINALHTNLALEISVRERIIGIPDENIKIRMENPKKDGRIEPLQLQVSDEDDKILALAGRLAIPGKKLALAHYLRENRLSGESIPDTNLKLVTLSTDALSLLNRNELDQMFSKDHYQLSIKTKNLGQGNSLATRLMGQLTPYLSPSQLKNIKDKIRQGKPIEVDSELLPSFAKEVITHHSIFKGPNCFHAALSFQGADLASNPNVNVREEPGYHRDMINYDELWRIVQLDFYEINPERFDIQYGDMVLFFDTPSPATSFVDFRSLRHAATYLVGGYAFSKGSKSANSPYLIRPLIDEWSTWTKFTERLGVKVYRRNLKHVKNGAPWEPKDWMY